MTESLSSNLVAELTEFTLSLANKGYSKPARLVKAAADEIERLTACFDAAKREWEIAAAERDRLTARVAELEANEIQDRKDMIRVDLDQFDWEDGEPMDTTEQVAWAEKQKAAKEERRQRRIAELRRELADLEGNQ